MKRTRTSRRTRKRTYTRLDKPRRSLGYDNGAVFKVKRMGIDGILASDTTGAFQITNTDAAAQPAWVNSIGTPSLDPAAFSNCYQVGVGCAFRLTDVPQATEFVNLFNEYRIDKIEFRFSPTFVGTEDVVGQHPSMYYTWDPNDAAAPNLSSTLQQFDTCKLVDFSVGQVKTIVGVPRAAQLIYSSEGGSSYGYQANKKAMWIDTSSPSNATPHYGLKLFFRNFASFLNSGVAIRMQPIYHFSFRRTR